MSAQAKIRLAVKRNTTLGVDVGTGCIAAVRYVPQKEERKNLLGDPIPRGSVPLTH